MRPLLLSISALCLLAACGPPAAGAASWSTPARVTSSADVQFDFAVAPDGRAAAAWVSGAYVRVAVRPPGGAWGASTRISSGRNSVNRPTVTVTGRGEVVVAWVQSSAPAGSGLVRGPLTIRSRARGRAGGWGSERKLGSTGHFVEAGIDLAANAAGESIAVWRGLRPEGRRHVGAVQSAFRRPSTAFGGTQTVVDPQDRSAGGQVVALDDRGTAHVAWNSGSAPVVKLASRTRGARGSWGTPRALGAAPSSNPRIAVSPDRRTTVIWRGASIDTEGNGTQSGALLTRTRNASGSLSAVAQLTATRVHGYWLAAGADGQVSAAWPEGGDEDGSGGTVRVRTRPSAGAAFGPEETIATGGTDEFHGGLAALSDGTLLFAWSFKTRTRVAARPPGGRFSAAEFDQPGSYPLIGAAGTGAVMAWNSIDGDAVGLQAAVRRS
jgi:hypothetical protein